jgi:glycosyltransferase involved in cell wall biosynthesis
MRFTVLSVAFPLTQVSEDSVGGAEQVLFALDAALESAGHRSIVIAGEGSAVRGTLIPVPAPEGPVTDGVKSAARERHRRAIGGALDHYPIDLVHLHGLDFHHYLPHAGVPVLATLHLPPSWYPAEVFQIDRPLTYLQCVSASAHRACPAVSGLLPPILNGVPVEGLTVQVRKREFALALGRICPEKGFHLALEAARQAKLPLAIGGRVYPYPEHVDYFDSEIAPRLDGRGWFLGPLSFERKRRLLTAARCLLIASVVNETSSLVAMEALACGTPVVAFRSPALEEIVEQERTGFLVVDPYEMAQAIPECARLDSGECRRAAQERFSAKRMTREYLALYDRLVRSRTGLLSAGLRRELSSPI